MSEKIEVDRLNIDEKDIENYKKLKMGHSPFAKKIGKTENKDLFLAAMIMGFKEKVRIELKKNYGFIMKSYLDPPDVALINAIAIAEKGNLNVLLNEKEVFSIAEEYANAGIKFLIDLAFGEDKFGSYSKRLESELLSTFNKIKNAQPEIERKPEELCTLSIEDLIKIWENANIEFKSSLLWDCEKKEKNKLMGMVVAKTISSFMNANGGILIIGVDNDRNIVGIEADLKCLKNQNIDQFEITFTNIISKYLGNLCRANVTISFPEYNGKKLALIKIMKSSRPVFVTYKGEKRFYLRQGNSSNPLDVEETAIYIHDNWPDTFV